MSEREVIDYINKFISQGHGSDKQFNELALYLFAYQYKNNLPYQQYCRQKGMTLRTVKTWKQIPSVPVDAFKEFSLSCIDPDKAERVFMTSGTTQGVQGKNYHPTLEIYDLSMKVHFKERFMGDHERIEMGILFPTEEEMPNSSLAHYLAFALEEFGTENSAYFMGDDGLETESLIKKLEHFEQSTEPYALLGASYSFVHILDELAKMEKTFKLPPGSRILDTGGFKNKSREMDLDDFYSRLCRFFGVERENCINMYGMTELSSQFYDDGNLVVPSVKSGPHWIKTRVINPITGQDVAKGEKGLLVHCDLANFNSVTTIHTEDLGLEVEDGFLLLGRAEGAEAKGCSIAVEDFIQARKGPSL